jgi:hypothetical protein
MKRSSKMNNHRRIKTLRKRFIKNNKPFNPTHIYLKNEKELETRTTKRAVLMS